MVTCQFFLCLVFLEKCILCWAAGAHAQCWEIRLGSFQGCRNLLGLSKPELFVKDSQVDTFLAFNQNSENNLKIYPLQIVSEEQSHSESKTLSQVIEPSFVLDEPSLPMLSNHLRLLSLERQPSQLNTNSASRSVQNQVLYSIFFLMLASFNGLYYSLRIYMLFND